jgi:hypothetical protein
MIRGEAFIEAGLFDESVRIVEDYPLYPHLGKRHPIVQSPGPCDQVGGHSGFAIAFASDNCP